MARREQDSTFGFVLLHLYFYASYNITLLALKWAWPDKTYLRGFIPYVLACFSAQLYFRVRGQRSGVLFDIVFVVLAFFIYAPVMALVNLGGFGQGEYGPAFKAALLDGAYAIPISVLSTAVAIALGGGVSVLLKTNE